MKNITIRLSPGSCDRALKQLGTYKNQVSRKADLLCKRLAEYGLTNAEVYFDAALYVGVKDVNLTVTKRDGGYSLIASGKTVAFLEFGAGVHYPNDHPKAGELGIEHGTYGKGKGANDYWFYTGQPGNAGGELARGHNNSTITHGNPANMPMFHTAQDIREEIVRIAQEVFAT